MSWQALSAAPLAFVRPAVVERCLEGCPIPWRDLLMTHPRFGQRVEAMLMDAHGLRPLTQLPAPDETTLKVLRLPPPRLAELGRLCGAIWHATTLAREVRGEVQRHLREHLGPGIYEQALALRDLAGAPDLLRDPDALLDAIVQDGAACLAQWLAQQPAPLRAWLALRLELPAAGEAVAAPPPALLASAANAWLDNPEHAA